MPSSRSYPDGALARPDGLNSSAHKHRRNYQSADATAEVMADRDMSVINNISIIGGNSSSRNGFRRPSASSSQHPRRTSSRRPSASSAAKHSPPASQQQHLQQQQHHQQHHQQQQQPQQQQELHHHQRSSRSSTSARNSASHSKSRPGSRSKHPSSSQIKYPQSPASPTNHQHHYGSNDHQAAPPSPPASNRNRDSFASIVDDPFFWRYDPAIPNPHPPLDTETDHHLAAATSYYEEEQTDSDESGSEDRWHPSYRESLTIGTNPLVSHIVPPMESFHIAIIGANGAGKSTFIQRVLGLPRQAPSSASSVRMVVDNVTYMATLLELDLESFDLKPSQPIQWPKRIDGLSVPRVDGAIILYDVSSKESVRQLPDTMTALAGSGLPAVLVANKCEEPDDEWEVDADGLAGHTLFDQCTAKFKVSAKTPEIGRAAVQAILKAAIAHKRDDQGDTLSRRRAQSANLEAPDAVAGRPVSQQSKHSRASSELSVLRQMSNPPNSDSYRVRMSRSPKLGRRSSDKPGTSNDFFLDVEVSDEEAPVNSDDGATKRQGEENQKVNGLLFDDLVDRLLALRLSRADNNFADIFLCLYRKFSTPGELFEAIMTRLKRVKEDKTLPYLASISTQLRIIEIVAKWVSLYPSDFSRVSKRKSLQDFVQQLSSEPVFCVASQQMRRSLSRCIMEDDDTGWAAEDDDDASADQLARDVGVVTGNIGKLIIDDELDEDRERGRSGTTGGYIQFHSYDEYEKEAMLLEPSYNLPMDKDRYHTLMEFSDDDIAEELTRIDWIMYSSIRIRDFVRYVSLSGNKKDKCKSLRNVNRMINHFNHVAKWVANLILLRDKARHRAQMLEKFMNIALRLRQLNNYNGLAAVLAGINGIAIHRLAQTRALVPADVQKRFARAVILMGTQKSHFAYRLAWENSPLPRIPFIPLHLRDLVSAEEGSKTYVGPSEDRINWKKFEVLGEVLLPLMRSQGTAYPHVGPNVAIRELILSCNMPTDEEEIYQRSVELESANGSTDANKKKFPWFAK